MSPLKRTTDLVLESGAQSWCAYTLINELEREGKIKRERRGRGGGIHNYPVKDIGGKAVA